ncbi:hypothetical protein RSJ42_15165 [Methanosarcina hadiensis]|uniref:hypothetical protein n=1 Tax=Methanosarcina hadiensis TaxID=3078083 RepID=UPI003977D6D7
MKSKVAQKENNKGMIPISRETFTALSQFFEVGRKSFKKRSKSKVAAATEAPSGTPGTDIIENVPDETELDGTKLVNVVKTP